MRYNQHVDEFGQDYIRELKNRARESHVYRSYQLTGLEIAELLCDERHKALYIKLAKQGSPEQLLALAKELSKKKDIKNKGAYFMRVLQANKRDDK